MDLDGKTLRYPSLGVAPTIYLMYSNFLPESTLQTAAARFPVLNPPDLLHTFEHLRLLSPTLHARSIEQSSLWISRCLGRRPCSYNRRNIGWLGNSRMKGADVYRADCKARQKP